MIKLQELFKKSNLDFLIVGLGNIGDDYSETRHNIGFMVVDEFCNNHNIILQKKNKYSGFFGAKEINGKLIGVLKPTTYMNLSGKSVKLITEYFNISINRIVVIYDEINFEIGKIQLKTGGSDGGHNGIKSINEYLQDNSYFKLRCGIDRKFSQGKLCDYVLSKFEETELIIKNEMIKNAVYALNFILNNDISKAMSFINSGQLWNDEKIIN